MLAVCTCSSPLVGSINRQHATATPLTHGCVWRQPCSFKQRWLAPSMLCSFDIEGESRSAVGNGGDEPAEYTAAVLKALQQAGAHGTAKAATPELNLGCTS